MQFLKFTAYTSHEVKSSSHRPTVEVELNLQCERAIFPHNMKDLITSHTSWRDISLSPDRCNVDRSASNDKEKCKSNSFRIDIKLTQSEI